VGRRRLSNEDSYVLCEDEGLGVVCDGMGGHDSGEIASRIAVDLFADQVPKARRALDDPRLKLSQARAMASDFIVEWTQQANERIHEDGKKAGGDKGLKSRMGTTLAAVFFVSDFVVVANVGDSRVYRVREGVIEQVSEDHTVVADAPRSPSDPRPPRKRKFVTRALGTKRKVEPDVAVLNAFPGDLFLLCSDGLTDLVEDEEILAIVEKAGVDRRKAVRSLIHLANKRGGTDNVTVVIADVIAGAEEEEEDDTDVLG